MQVLISQPKGSRISLLVAGEGYVPTAEPLQTEALHTTSHLRTQAAFCLYSVSQPCPPSWYVRDSLHTFPYLFHTRGSGLFTLPKECPSSLLLTHTLHILAPYSTLFCFLTWTFKFPLTKDFRCPRSHFFSSQCQLPAMLSRLDLFSLFNQISHFLPRNQSWTSQIIRRSIQR